MVKDGFVKTIGAFKVERPKLKSLLTLKVERAKSKALSPTQNFPKYLRT